MLISGVVLYMKAPHGLRSCPCSGRSAGFVVAGAQFCCQFKCLWCLFIYNQGSKVMDLPACFVVYSGVGRVRVVLLPAPIAAFQARVKAGRTGTPGPRLVTHHGDREHYQPPTRGHPETSPRPPQTEFPTNLPPDHTDLQVVPAALPSPNASLLH